MDIVEIENLRPPNVERRNSKASTSVQTSHSLSDGVLRERVSINKITFMKKSL